MADIITVSINLSLRGILLSCQLKYCHLGYYMGNIRILYPRRALIHTQHIHISRQTDRQRHTHTHAWLQTLHNTHSHTSNGVV